MSAATLVCANSLGEPISPLHDQRASLLVRMEACGGAHDWARKLVTGRYNRAPDDRHIEATRTGL